MLDEVEVVIRKRDEAVERQRVTSAAAAVGASRVQLLGA